MQKTTVKLSLPGTHALINPISPDKPTKHQTANKDWKNRSLFDFAFSLSFLISSSHFYPIIFLLTLLSFPCQHCQRDHFGPLPLSPRSRGLTIASFPIRIFYFFSYSVQQYVHVPQNRFLFFSFQHPVISVLSTIPHIPSIIYRLPISHLNTQKPLVTRAFVHIDIIFGR